jgi:serine/threonine protein kinase
MEGSSRRAHTTIYSRGTSSYRAPELLRETQSKYTNKVYMWAIGCILYELVLRQRAFENDLAVLLHATSGNDFEFALESEIVPDERKRDFILRIVKELLDIDPSQRPKACTLYERFISWGSDQSMRSASTPSSQSMAQNSALPSAHLSPRLLSANSGILTGEIPESSISKIDALVTSRNTLSGIKSPSSQNAEEMLEDQHNLIEPITVVLDTQKPTHFNQILGSFKPSREEHSTPKRILITPWGSTLEARKHWEDTVEQSVRFLDDLLSSKLDVIHLTRLKRLHPDGQAQFWGSRPVHDKKLANINSGDLALFTGGGHVVGIARVGVIFQNAAFADILWRPKPGEQSWHTVFSLLDFMNTYIPNAELNEILGYKLGNHYQSLVVPDETKAQKLLVKLVNMEKIIP